ncbi:lipid droplet-associated hydrolase isoform X2 [Prunus yedoensis var. nudiflora]|uniref:Lipid droplet-associated hydrolase isoform X2 n=1 Tax=Prunus yedoensis var. nudiflora TaxID=2094558 RepID=A0A314UF36_PRUYE|nr:lipid droplet-associated hydrolase isoform X2 [Prunus yedoensis var. nudiflora]
MLLRLFPSIARPFFSLSSRSRLYCASKEMGQDSSECEVIQVKRRASFRLCNVSSYTTEILEILADDPTLHVVVIPGNPGVVLFYKEFLESLYELLGGTASVTAVGHISQTKKSWEHGRLFSLQEQINHKVGHSIGSYISVEMFKRSQRRSRILCVVFSFIVALLGLLPIRLLRLIVTMFLGKFWSATAVDAVCSHLLKYHTMRNVLFLAMTEFRKLSETPDWAFMRANQHKIAFLFAIDDHWGPLQMFEEISKQVPDAALSIDREGLTDHGFCCTEAGSSWVAEHVTKLIKNQKASE